MAHGGTITAAGHQPHYLPWLGYVDKASKVDVFCLMDTVPFEAHLFQHRNRIRAVDGEAENWLVVPVTTRETPGPPIMDVAIDERVRWREDHWRRVEAAYGDAPHFAAYAPFFVDVYAREWKRLVDLNHHMLEGILRFLGIRTRVVRASALGCVPGDPNVLVEVCRAVGARTYLSGAGGNCVHLDETRLHAAGIEHRKQEFTHPSYPQGEARGSGFVPRLAVVDLLFNCGPDAVRFFPG
jgi:hypothetical protein